MYSLFAQGVGAISDDGGVGYMIACLIVGFVVYYLLFGNK